MDVRANVIFCAQSWQFWEAENVYRYGIIELWIP